MNKSPHNFDESLDYEHSNYAKADRFYKEILQATSIKDIILIIH